MGCRGAHKPVSDTSCCAKHGAQRLQQPGKDKDWLPPDHLLAEVGCEGRIEPAHLLEPLCHLHIHAQGSGKVSETNATLPELSLTGNAYGWTHDVIGRRQG